MISKFIVSSYVWLRERERERERERVRGKRPSMKAKRGNLFFAVYNKMLIELMVHYHECFNSNSNRTKFDKL